eukprot:TCONS_00021994-protein
METRLKGEICCTFFFLLLWIFFAHEMLSVKALVILLMCSMWVNGKHRTRHHHGVKHTNNLHFIQQYAESALPNDVTIGRIENNTITIGQAGKRDQTANKRSTADTDVAKLVKELGNVNLNEFTSTKMTKTKGGLATSLGAAESLYDKIEKKDKMGIAISSITIVSGIASMVGGPVGYLVAMSLDIIKTILTIIDKKKNGPPESEASKLQKAIEKALRKFSETQLSADWNGYKRLTEVYLKHLDMIEKFDEVKPLVGEDKKQFNIEDMGGKEEVKQQLFDEVTPQIYKVLTSSTHLLGKIEHHISKVCDFDIQARKVKSERKILHVEEREPIPTQDEIEEKDTFATNCLKLYELYSKISSYHYQTYLKSLEVIHKIVGEKYFDNVSSGKTPSESDDNAIPNNPGASNGNPAPSKSNPAPSKSNPAPSKSNPAPSKSNPAPSKTNSAPSKSNPAPSKSNPAPSKNNPAPSKSNNKKPSKRTMDQAKKEKSRRKAYVFMHLLLDMIQNSREYNKKVFKPFLNPFEHYKMRYTVNYYYNNEKMYEHLSTYLKDFFTDKETMKTVPKKVMFCSQQSLLGSCYLEDGPKAQDPGPWRSAYVPKGKSITVEYQLKANKAITFDAAKGLPIKLIGPASMGMLFTMKMLFKTKLLSTNNAYDNEVEEMKKFDGYVKQITVADEEEPLKDDQGKPKQASKKSFKMCVTRDYLQESPRHHSSVCITDEYKGAVKTISFSEIKSPTKWEGKNISLSCSEPDLAFVGTYKSGKQDINKLDARWGPFFSPFPMMQLPGSVQWDSITVYPYKNEIDSTVAAIAKNDKVCNGDNNLLCQGETIDKKLFVTICKEAELKGYCEEIPVLKTEITAKKEKTVQLTVINGNGIYGKIKPLESMYSIGTQKVPDETALIHTENFDSYYDVDNSIWQPMLKDSGKKAYNLLQSMKVPDDVMVELYTKEDSKKNKKMFGPYQGPLTVDRIDGNDVISNIIETIVIKSVSKEILPEDTASAGDQPDIEVQAEDPDMPNDAEPEGASAPTGSDIGESTTDPNTIGDTVGDSAAGSSNPSTGAAKP